MEMLLHDLRFALRTMKRSPAFALAAVLTLALGIGASAALFSAVDALLLRPLPVEKPERLVEVSTVLSFGGDALACPQRETLREWHFNFPLRTNDHQAEQSES